MNEILKSLPGYELVEKGLSDLRNGLVTPESLLIEIGAPRLVRCGLRLPTPPMRDEPAEHALYDLLRRSGRPDPYSAYNALIRRLVSFEHALEYRNNRDG